MWFLLAMGRSLNGTEGVENSSINSRHDVMLPSTWGLGANVLHQQDPISYQLFRQKSLHDLNFVSLCVFLYFTLVHWIH